MDSFQVPVGYAEASPEVDDEGRTKLAELFLVDSATVRDAFAGDSDFDNGRNAWLGDAMIHADLSHLLFALLPSYDKGGLSAARQTAESNAAMATFLKCGTDAEDFNVRQLGTHALGSAFEALYKAASPLGRRRSLTFYLRWLAVHKDPKFMVVAKTIHRDGSEKEEWDWVDSRLSSLDTTSAEAVLSLMHTHKAVAEVSKIGNL